MILRALSLGVPEARLASALNVNIKTLKQKRQLLDGICEEAAQLMVAMNKFTINYARSLLAATPERQLVSAATPKKIKGISREQLERMERESANLEREVRLVEDSYGADHLDLALTRGFIAKQMRSEQITRYLSLHHDAFLPAFEKITENEAFTS
ncbi:plasmid partitioning protein RepB C-terminal domain-containing protein [Ruegeria sp. ANG-R]|uniref:plasmid partitioning protein RepB C-terminal domain-containing protein n=1 Tax=Ruegeria sp. ANG-R TaxID=1577903 RepID=UPI00068E7EF9|nr:plasmid partitioning protein RepB C-terminal domain-containing protein [Ruegeria sp. ANG-R]